MPGWVIFLIVIAIIGVGMFALYKFGDKQQKKQQEQTGLPPPRPPTADHLQSRAKRKGSRAEPASQARRQPR